MLAKVIRTISIVLVAFGMGMLVSIQGANFTFYLISLAMMVLGGLGYKYSDYFNR